MSRSIIGVGTRIVLITSGKTVRKSSGKGSATRLARKRTSISDADVRYVPSVQPWNIEIASNAQSCNPSVITMKSGLIWRM